MYAVFATANTFVGVVAAAAAVIDVT